MGAARVSTSTSPGPGTGVATSRACNASGGPNSSTTIARTSLALRRCRRSPTYRLRMHPAFRYPADQLALDDLAAGRQRHLGEKDDELRHVVSRHPCGGQMLEDSVRIGLRVRRRHDGEADAIAE